MLRRTMSEGRRPLQVPYPGSSLVHKAQVLLRAHTTNADLKTGRSFNDRLRRALGFTRPVARPGDAGNGR